MNFSSCRKIIQWISGIFFVSALTAVLLLSSLARLSSPDIAKPTISGIYKETLVRSQLAQSFDSIQALVKTLPPDQPLPIPNLPRIHITAGEAAGLSQEELVERISSEAADQFYKDTSEMSAPADITTSSFGLLAAVFSADANKVISRTSTALWVLTALAGLIMVGFSIRFGRIGSLGLGLLIGSLLPLGIFTLVVIRIDSTQDMLNITGEDSQVLIPFFDALKQTADMSRNLATTVMAAGIVLLLIAIIGGLVTKKPRRTPR